MKDSIAKLRGELFRLTCRFFRKNIYIKKGLRIYKKFKIEGKGKVYIGMNCTIDGMKGDDSQYVTIDTHSNNSVINIGDNVSLYAARISSKFQITLGNDVLIEESGIVDTDFHSIDRDHGEPTNENMEKCRISVGNRVCIGAGSTITKGLSIGDDVMIVPGSVVTSSIKSGSFVLGNPARPFKI